MGQVYGKIFEKEILSPTHLKIIELVGSNKSILELGCSTGYLTKEFLKNGCSVDIVEKDPDDYKQAQKYAKKAFRGSLDDEYLLKKIDQKYDFVVAADILEHLQNPENALKLLKKNLNKSGLLIISTPNIACWQIRKDLFFKGEFEYQDLGIMDKTHLKFFTYKTIQKMLNSLGYRISHIHKIEVDYPLRQTVLNMGILGKFFDGLIGKNIIKAFPNLCTAHMILEARIG